MGGKVAQMVSLLYPERVAGLVVLDMAPVEYTERDASWKAVKDIIELLANVELEDADKRQVDLQLRKALPDPALWAFVLTNLDTKTMEWNIPVDVLANQLETLAGFRNDDDDDASSLQYDGDAFFIHGGQSKFVRHAYMETIASFFPNHMLTTIRGAGHWVHAEAPDDTIALLKRFLDR